MRPLLLDTNAAIWMSRDEPITATAQELMKAASHSDIPVYVSPITAWEVGLLVAHNRLILLMTPQRWFAALLTVPSMQLAEMPPELLIASSFLPGTLPRDPADRIIAATARDLGATLITRDRALLDYGKQGHISVVRC